MPQLTPFLFTNQFVFAFGGLIILVYIIGTYILPLFTTSNVTRLYVTKL